jgi:hypothetical protein
MPISDDALEELAHSVNIATNSLEIGRRVGWAKAFDAMRRADTAERDFNVMTADRDILANFGARALGALTVILDRAVNELFRGDHHELKSFFPDGPFRSGQDAARSLMNRGLVAAAVIKLRAEILEQQARLDVLRQQHVELKKRHGELAEETERARRANKRAVHADLCEQFGFADQATFFGYLAKYRELTR